MYRFSTVAFAATTLVTIGAPFAASAQDSPPSDPPAFTLVTRVPGTIVDVAAGNPEFSTLVAALQAADLVATLQGPGPFTVFAPTNDAFAKMPQALLDYLLASPEDLTHVLLYHVAPDFNDIRFRFRPRAVATVQGQNVYADRDADELRVNNSNVINGVIRTDNGVIYVIDSVLLPQYQ